MASTARIDDQREPDIAGQRDGGEVLLQIKAGLGLQAHVDGVARERSHQQGVAVGVRPRDGRGSQTSGSAWSVLNDHALTNGVRHLLGNDAADDVRRTTRSIGHDERDRTGWVVLLGEGARFQPNTPLRRGLRRR